MFARKLFQRTAPVAVKQSVRRMGGGHAPPPTDGLDGIVRKYLPRDEQVVLAIMGFYASIFLIAKAWPSKKKAAVEAPAAVSVNTGAVPSVESPEFDAWINTPGNLEKLLQE